MTECNDQNNKKMISLGAREPTEVSKSIGLPSSMVPRREDSFSTIYYDPVFEALMRDAEIQESKHEKTKSQRSWERVKTGCLLLLLVSLIFSGIWNNVR